MYHAALPCKVAFIPFRPHLLCDRDLNNGGALGSFKNNASPVNGLTRVGDDYFMACQTTKTGVHAWTWAKVCREWCAPGMADMGGLFHN